MKSYRFVRTSYPATSIVIFANIANGNFNCASLSTYEKLYLEFPPLMRAIQGKDPNPASVPPTTLLKKYTELNILYTAAHTSKKRKKGIMLSVKLTKIFLVKTILNLIFLAYLVDEPINAS